MIVIIGVDVFVAVLARTVVKLSCSSLSTLRGGDHPVSREDQRVWRKVQTVYS